MAARVAARRGEGRERGKRVGLQIGATDEEAALLFDRERLCGRRHRGKQGQQDRGKHLAGHFCLLAAMNSRTAELNASGCSHCSAWPASGTMTTRLLGIFSPTCRSRKGGIQRSASPVISRVGTSSLASTSQVALFRRRTVEPLPARSCPAFP